MELMIMNCYAIGATTSLSRMHLNEAALMFEQGGTIEEIDRALVKFGMPMGAFMLLDEIGIDIAHTVADILHNGLGERVKPSGLLAALYQEGYLGKKIVKGFYSYTGKKRGKPDASLYKLISAETGRRGAIPPDEIVDRATLLMVKEAALCLEEIIIDLPDLLDAALIFGIGFPPFRSGLLKYADTIGAKAIVEKLEGYAQKYGERFAPPVSLVEMVRSGKAFYQ